MSKNIRFLMILVALVGLTACVPAGGVMQEEATIEPTETASASHTPTPSQTPTTPESRPSETGSPNQSGPLVEWQRSGGIAGLCRHLTLYSDGRYVYSDCRELSILSEGKLSIAQMEPFTEYAARYASFRWELKPPKKAADMFVDWYVFHGNGNETPSEETMQEINNRLARLTAELASQGKQSRNQGSGIRNLVMIGSNSPGPERKVALKFPSHPYQAILVIQDARGNPIAKA